MNPICPHTTGTPFSVREVGQPEPNRALGHLVVRNVLIILFGPVSIGNKVNVRLLEDQVLTPRKSRLSEAKSQIWMGRIICKFSHCGAFTDDDFLMTAFANCSAFEKFPQAQVPISCANVNSCRKLAGSLILSRHKVAAAACRPRLGNSQADGMCRLHNQRYEFSFLFPALIQSTAVQTWSQLLSMEYHVKGLES